MSSPTAQPKTPAERFRPPIVSVVFAACWGAGAWYLYDWGMRGLEWATLGSAIAALLATTSLFKALNDHLLRVKQRRLKDRFLQSAKSHGTARWATEGDLRSSKLVSNVAGVFIGMLVLAGKRLLKVFAAGVYHIAVIAPPGSGKTMAILVTTLLSWTAKLGNLIVNDPSGELLSICRKYLESIGYRVIVVTPFAAELARLIKQEVIDAGIDFFATICEGMDPTTIRDELYRIAACVVQGKPDQDEKSEFFMRAAHQLFVFFCLLMLTENLKPSLSGIRKRLMHGCNGLEETFHEATESNAFGGVLAELANSLLGVLTAAPQQFAGGFGLLEQAVEQFDEHGSFGAHTSHCDWSPSSLKDPKQKVAVFVCYPPAKMEIFHRQLAMTLTYLFDTVASDNQPGRVTALVDECGALVMPRLASQLNFYRKVGLRCVLVFQDLAGQAEKTYGRATVKQLMAACLMKIGIGLVEPETLNLFSQLCGQQAIVDMNLNDRSQTTDPLPNLQQSLSAKSAPLARAEFIRELPDDQLLCVVGNLPPMLLQKTPYWTRPEWVRVAGPSPYHHDEL